MEMNVENNKITGERVKELREKKRMSQGDLSDAIGYKSKSAITKIENGDQKIPYKKLDKFANVLGTSKEYLTGESDDPNSNYISFMGWYSHDDSKKNNLNSYFNKSINDLLDNAFSGNEDLLETVRTLIRYARDLSPNDLSEIRDFISKKAGKSVEE